MIAESSLRFRKSGSDGRPNCICDIAKSLVAAFAIHGNGRNGVLRVDIERNGFPCLLPCIVIATRWYDVVREITVRFLII